MTDYLESIGMRATNGPTKPAEGDTHIGRLIEITGNGPPEPVKHDPDPKHESRVPGRTVDRVIAAFRRWLYLPDPGPLLAVLGALAANRLEGDPVWLLLVAPPGGGKSELVGAVTGLTDVYPAATLTEAALLSGTPKREHDDAAKGGLLRAIGAFGVLLCKDFGSVLNMNRDARASLLAALREVYDGSWTRHVGTDGGKTLHWQGKVGLIGGCTPTIDRHHAVMGAMGERFVLYRLPNADADEQARRALAHAGRERQMREELAEAVNTLFGQGLREPVPLVDDERERLISLTTLTVRCRSAVERDGHSREVELIPESEAPTRLIVVLAQLLAGLNAIGVEREQSWAIVTKAALDSMPALRRAVLDVLFQETDVPTPAIAEAVRHPTSTTRRALEDLAAHRVVKRTPQGQGKADHWSLTEFARSRYAAALGVPETSVTNDQEGVPETSELPLTYPHRVNDDISGTVEQGEAEVAW
jgi:hypothetical protein